MRMTTPIGAAAFLAMIGLTAGASHAASAVQKECSTKYQAAKAANQLNGMTWNQFYKQCAVAVRSEPTASPPTSAPTPAPATATAPVAPMAPAAGGAAVFPTAVSPEFSKESAGKARMHTCLAQYKANKQTNGNGGLRWIQKGGGYYSECNKRLKG